MIYFDANATARPRPVASESVAVLLDQASAVGNASSIHQAGRNARMALERARNQVLAFALGEGAANAKLTFTSGGTEGCNSMIFGFLGPRERLTERPAHIVCSAIEHAAVLEPVKLLESVGWTVSYVTPKKNGIVKADDFLANVRGNTVLVTLMAANNETGAVQPIAELATALRREGFAGIIASDITQALGKTELSVASLFLSGVNVAAFSGHKLGSLAGVGGVVYSNLSDSCHVYYADRVGGPQEGRFRAGSENLIGVVSLGETAHYLNGQRAQEISKISALREQFWSSLEDNAGEVVRITPPSGSSISNTLAVRFPGCRGDDLVVALDLHGVCASTGAACASGKQEVSHVYRAMGLSQEQAREVIRLSLDWDATSELVEEGAQIIGQTVGEMRARR